MEPTYKAINYLLRPAKNIERKMMCEAFRRLGVFGELKGYRYIGLGSIFFGDFVLFHKRLGFTKMISIESHKEDGLRVEFNKPFACVDIKLGHSKAVLGEIALGEGKSVIWLDYDYELAESVLNDIERVVAECQPGTFLAITVDAESKRLEQPKSLGDEEPEIPWPTRPVDQLKRLVGQGRVPASVTSESLRGGALKETYRAIMSGVAQEALAARNGALEAGAKLKCQQVFNFWYADGAEMMTIGWLLYEERQESFLERCAFDKLEFYRPGSEAFRIVVPNLTYREIRALDKECPENGGAGAVAPVPEEDWGWYRKVYRYFPSFTEGEL
jgi:hypothetical protein